MHTGPGSSSCDLPRIASVQRQLRVRMTCSNIQGSTVWAHVESTRPQRATVTSTDASVALCDPCWSMLVAGHVQPNQTRLADTCRCSPRKGPDSTAQVSSPSDRSRRKYFSSLRQRIDSLISSLILKGAGMLKIRTPTSIFFL